MSEEEPKVIIDVKPSSTQSQTKENEDKVILSVENYGRANPICAFLRKKHFGKY
ncbi:MAG: hypothetical protein MZV64_64865 [Ignavibacteriales bacterium]|nr:hypothetical protein [Ignavibacteriales bacterium]